MVNDESNRKFTKGTWTKAEDQQLMEIVREMGPKRWSTIAEKLEGRIGKQCRERWYNHLDPNVKKEWWTPREDHTIIEHHERYGNQWSQIAKKLEGRPANAIKNHWNSTLKRVVKRAKMGLKESGIYTVQLPPCPKRKKGAENSGATINVFLNINTPLAQPPSIPKTRKIPATKYKKRSASQRRAMDHTEEEFHSPARKKLKRGRGRPAKRRSEELIARVPYPTSDLQVVRKHQSFAHLNFTNNGLPMTETPQQPSTLTSTTKTQQPPFGTSPNKTDSYIDLAIFDENHYVNPSSSSQNFPTIADMSSMEQIPSSNSQNGWGTINNTKTFPNTSFEADVLPYDENSMNNYSFTAANMDPHFFISPEKSQQGWEHDSNSNSNMQMSFLTNFQ